MDLIQVSREHHHFEDLLLTCLLKLLNKQNYGLGIDWYLWGVLLYEMLTGLPPYFDQDTKKLQKNIANMKLEIPDDVTEECQDLLK